MPSQTLYNAYVSSFKARLLKMIIIMCSSDQYSVNNILQKSEWLCE